MPIDYEKADKAKSWSVVAFVGQTAYAAIGPFETWDKAHDWIQGRGWTSRIHAVIVAYHDPSSYG